MAELAASALPTEEDYRRYDRIWRKVSPEYNPYPEARTAQGKTCPMPETEIITLSAAGGDPCCMGSIAQGGIDVLQGFLREEIADARIYRELARCTMNREARQVFRRIADAETEHVRQLQAANYLITCECYRVTVCFAPPHRKDYCATLRERWHKEVCDGFNYERASEETEDFCLRKLFGQLAKDEYRHAEWLRCLLAKAL